MFQGIMRRHYQTQIAELLDRVKRRTKGKQRKLYIYSKKRKHIFPKTLIIPLIIDNKGSEVGEIFHGILAIEKSKQFYPSFMNFVWYPAYRPFFVGIHSYIMDKSYFSFKYQKLISFEVLYIGFVFSYRNKPKMCFRSLVLRAGNGKIITYSAVKKLLVVNAYSKHAHCNLI